VIYFEVRNKRMSMFLDFDVVETSVDIHSRRQ